MRICRNTACQHQGIKSRFVKCRRGLLNNSVNYLLGIGSRHVCAVDRLVLLCRRIEIIERAYEITVNATNTASIPYANSILESWYSKGYRTIEQIEEAEAQRKAQKVEGSFDTDDFFEAALQRSYGSKK